MTMISPPPLEQENEEMLVPHQEFTEGPQPMEVLSAETVSTPANPQAEDPPTLKYRWTIENFSRLNNKKLYSDIFHVGRYKWRALIFPKGNNVDCLSIYLDVADSATLPYGWSRYAQFSLAVVNRIHGKYTIRKDTQHQFNGQESDWGFTSFMSLSEFYDPSRGYLINDTCVIEVEVTVPKVVDYWNYDSEKETDYVGLKTQEATCYMNSLLQTLYHIPYFRKAVYHMPTAENDMPARSFPLALQSLLYKFLYNDNSVATKELTKSFGWDSFVPHDVQELNRVFCEKLEGKMKGTVVGATIQHLFEGHYMNYIECIKSTQKESFYDLQLDVKGSWDVYASFDKYVKVEWLEGDNKYQIENLGLQLEDGDIICYPKSLTSTNIHQFRYPNFPSFLEYIYNCQNIDAYLVAVSAQRPGTDVGYASASGVPHWRNLQFDELANNQLFTENEPSVVFIESRLPPGAIGSGFIGSGFIWDTDGHIVTNYHVIDGAHVLSVTLADETGFKAKVVGCDRDNDVAVLLIDAPKEKLRPIKVGISSNLLMGQKVFAIGHPFGMLYTFTDGIISGLRRTFRSPANGQPIQDAIQTNVPINPGNSGGPLLDSSGYLIGIVTAIYSKIRESCGIAFAVPVDTVKDTVDQIVNFGEVRRPISGDSESLQGDQVSVVLEPNPDAP